MDLVAARGEDGADFEDGGWERVLECEFLVLTYTEFKRWEGWEHGVELDVPA